MDQYHEYLAWIISEGVDKGDRTGTGTRSAFGGRMEFDLADGFPIVTTKYTYWKGIIAELCWFLQGGTNTKQLHEWGCKIWDEWADENGELGPVYGAQWRAWQVQRYEVERGSKSYNIGHGVRAWTETIDQIAYIEKTLKSNPNDRRMIVSAWNVADIPLMGLPPCHLLWQLWVDTTTDPHKLSLQIYQRSVDSFLGLPFNIASYAALLALLAARADMEPDRLVWVGGDCHIYNNHWDQVHELLGRDPLPLPKLTISEKAWALPIDQMRPEFFVLDGYKHHGVLKGEVAV